MAEELSRTQKMQIIFKQHPNAQEFYVTSDDQAFYLPSDAKNHASTLDDKTVDCIKRRDILKDAKIENGGDKKTDRQALFEELKNLGGSAPTNISDAKLLAKVEELKKSAPKMIDVTVTQEMLDQNPELVAEGVKVGETIQIPDTEKE
ncbi:hypothetical protein [Pedobacter sp.]|uniref:hypothetical protein n=1 Tax=Pedobacter sp. TaxID=1411316 RepID=UPI00396C8329